jgi:hypothetical protein
MKKSCEQDKRNNLNNQNFPAGLALDLRGFTWKIAQIIK